MSGVPRLAKGQKYQLTCGKCGGASLVRGVSQIKEPEGEPEWSASEIKTEFACTRQSCGHVSLLVVRTDQTGTALWWRDFVGNAPSMFDGVRGGLKS